MSFKSLWILSVLPLFWLLYQSHSTGLAILSPQGCRMSWMSPSYLVQDEFNTTWTPLARRYSLLLYREVGWDSETPSGRPVLFIPGNAGSSHQVRSIASSASRQFYSSPHVRSTDFPANVEPLDLYAVDFNEDLSALHGPTLQTQTAYVNAALEYIASKYPQKRNLQITLLGHSMGGIVALNALRSSRYIPLVSAVITMSSPHSLPPARLDQEIERTFSTSLDVVWNASSFDHSTGYSPPILALCGGATDNMLPMESCALPPPPAHIAPNAENLYRRTIFTSGLDGTWTGVGHREMVWCHQVRWRVARAALELAVSDPDARGAILDRWFAGIPGQSVPSQIISPNNPTIDVSADQLVSRQIPSGTIAYRFPTTSVGQYLVVMLAQGRIAGIAPEKEVLSDARVDVCESSPHSEVVCKPAATKFVRLVPNPPLHSLFPIPGEGVDESEGVVVWEAEPLEVEGRYFVLTVASTGNAGSWLFAKIQSSGTADFVTYDNNKLTPFLGTAKLDLSSKTNSIRRVWLPNLVSNALVVYRAKFTHTGDCTDPLLAPILVHTSSNAESHFHRTIPSPDGVFLHTHSSGPFLGTKYGVNLTVYSSGECHVDKIEISVDWRSSVGRAASRLWAGVFAWAVATAAAMNTLAWYEWDGSRQFPTLQQSFERIVWRFAVLSLGGVTALGLLPLPSSFMLGLSGEPLFFILAPTSLAIAAATVGCSCYLLVALQWIFGKLYQTLTVLGLSTDTDTRRHPFTRSSAVFHVLLGVSVMVVIPYQVAYLVAFLLHLWECSISRVQLKRQNRDPNSVSSYAQACHLLLLLFWLLPLVAPVLIVWARTLINAGVTTPFDGDHNVLNVMFVVMCVELGGSRLPNKSSSLYRLSLAFSYLLLSLVAIVLGARYTYFLYIFFNMCCACFVIGTVGGGQAVSHP